MPLDDQKLRTIIESALDQFYERRLQKLSGLQLKDTLRKKNPYLFRAMGVHTTSELVEKLLQAYMSSSEETIFGDAFFEPVVREVCSGVASNGTGVDVIIESKEEYTVVSVKSGPNWGNSSQMSKLNQDFEQARRVFDNKKLRKTFRALLGHCYGRKRCETARGRSYCTLSGQSFWEELTGDPDFYIKLISLMDEYPLSHRTTYEIAWDKAIDRFTKQLIDEFAHDDGSVDWEKLVKFNSGSKQ